MESLSLSLSRATQNRERGKGGKGGRRTICYFQFWARPSFFSSSSLYSTHSHSPDKRKRERERTKKTFFYVFHQLPQAGGGGGGGYGVRTYILWHTALFRICMHIMHKFTHTNAGATVDSHTHRAMHTWVHALYLQALTSL